MFRRKTDLAGRRALVTGATGGLGQVIALALAERGIHLALTDRPGADFTAQVQKLRTFGIDVVTTEADLTDHGAAERIIQAVEAELGPLDILINNAGIEFVNPWHRRTAEDLTFEVELNLIAPMLLTQAVLPGMVERGRGHVLTISSIGGMIAIPYLIGYAASKHGIAAYNRALSAELGDQGIRITTVFPGLVRDAGMGARYTEWLVPRGLSRFVTKTPHQVGAGVVRGLETGRSEVVISSTPTRPVALLTALRPEITIRMLQRLRKWGAPRLDASLEQTSATPALTTNMEKK